MTDTAPPAADAPTSTPTPTITGAAAAASATTFAHRMWRIAAAHVSGGNTFELLRNGPATFDAMLALIAAAREEVALESYILRSDSVGRRFAPALAAAAARGVRVRVLYDWVGSRGTSAAFVAELRDAGVDVRVFNPPKLGARWLGVVPRDHRKLLVVDGETDRGAGVTGGVGLGHEWSEGEHPGRPGSGPWRDTAVQIRGPAARSMLHAFERMWALTPRYVRKHPEASRPTIAPHAAAGAPTTPGATGVVGIVEGEPGRYRVSRALEAVAVEAQRTIWIADAYFTPSPDLVEGLTGAARDGVDVRLLVPGRGDHPWVVPLTRRYYARLRRNGVRVWEWQGEMMHAKTQVSDGRYTRVGSTDFNPLGVAINFELDAVIDDAGLGARGARAHVRRGRVARARAAGLGERARGRGGVAGRGAGLLRGHAGGARARARGGAGGEPGRGTRRRRRHARAGRPALRARDRGADGGRAGRPRAPLRGRDGVGRGAAGRRAGGAVRARRGAGPGAADAGGGLALERRRALGAAVGRAARGARRVRPGKLRRGGGAAVRAGAGVDAGRLGDGAARGPAVRPGDGGGAGGVRRAGEAAGVPARGAAVGAAEGGADRPLRGYGAPRPLPPTDRDPGRGPLSFRRRAAAGGPPALGPRPNARRLTHAVRLMTALGGEHHPTIPDHDARRVGTRSAILSAGADHFATDRDEVARRVFGV